MFILKGRYLEIVFFGNRAIHGVLRYFWLFEYESFVLVASGSWCVGVGGVGLLVAACQ